MLLETIDWEGVTYSNGMKDAVYGLAPPPP